VKRFEFSRFNPLLWPLFLIGLTIPSRAWVGVDNDFVRIRLGLAFRATIRRSSVRSAARDNDRIGGIGAHGWSGEWLVNTSGKGLVRLEISPATHGRVLGWPVLLDVLRLSLAEPDEFVAVLTEQ
jgi:hypothetical protein